MSKDEILEFIKGFQKITLKNACSKANVNYINLYKGRVSKEKLEKLKRILEDELAKLYILDKE